MIKLHFKIFASLKFTFLVQLPSLLFEIITELFNFVYSHSFVKLNHSSFLFVSTFLNIPSMLAFGLWSTMFCEHKNLFLVLRLNFFSFFSLFCVHYTFFFPFLLAYLIMMEEHFLFLFLVVGMGRFYFLKQCSRDVVSLI